MSPTNNSRAQDESGQTQTKNGGGGSIIPYDYIEGYNFPSPVLQRLDDLVRPALVVLHDVDQVVEPAFVALRGGG